MLQTGWFVLVVLLVVIWKGVLSQNVVFCESGPKECVEVDPCGSCGIGVCSNLDSSCLASGRLKGGWFGKECRLRYTSIPAGLHVKFFNLYGGWSGYDNCAMDGDQKEEWDGPRSGQLGDNRCAVKISALPRYSCGTCSAGYYRSQQNGLAQCRQCSTSRCANGQYRGSCQYASNGVCTSCTNKPSAPAYYIGSGNPYNVNNCAWECPAGYSQEYQCNACQPGEYQPSAGQTACLLCPAGKYQPSNAQTVCEDCAAGSITLSQGQSSCNLCGAGHVQPDPGKTLCLQCSEGTFQDEMGQAECEECIAGTYQDQIGGTHCFSCSELNPPPEQPCQTCNSEGIHATIDNFCFSQGRCFSAVHTQGSPHTFVPRPILPQFENGTDNFGCSFCSSSSPNALMQVEDGEICPSLRCIQHADTAFHTYCSSGTCLDQVESLSIARSECKECHECADPSLGCQLRQFHCELDDQTCGCLIDGECHDPESTEPGNQCRRAARQYTTAAQRCTGSWVNVYDQPMNCVGETACHKNQRCENGTCHSKPYGEVLPCHQSFECTGNLPEGADPSEDGYQYLPWVSSGEPKLCREKHRDEACDVAEFCMEGLLTCPPEVIVTPTITNTADLAVMLRSSLSQHVQPTNPARRYISPRLASAMSMIGEPEVVCVTPSGPLQSCPFAERGAGADGVRECGVALRHDYLHVVAAKWYECTSDSLRDPSVLRELSAGLTSHQNSSSTNTTTTDCEEPRPGCEACVINTYMGGCNTTCNRDLTCSGHGRCRGWTGKCICDEGWLGEDCIARADQPTSLSSTTKTKTIEPSTSSLKTATPVPASSSATTTTTTPIVSFATTTHQTTLSSSTSNLDRTDNPSNQTELCVFYDPTARPMVMMASAAGLDAGDLLLRDALVGVADGDSVRGIVLFYLDGNPQSPVCSEEYVVDNSAPPTGRFDVEAPRGDDGTVYLGSSYLAVFSWDLWEWNDPHSGFGQARLVVFRCSNGTVKLMAETKFTTEEDALNGSTTVRLPAQEDGAVLLAQFMVMNGAGLMSASVPIEMTVDSSPPFVGNGTVRDCVPDGEGDFDFQPGGEGLAACWDTLTITDPISGIIRIDAITERRQVSDSEGWTAIASCQLAAHSTNVSFKCNGMASGGDCSMPCLQHGAQYRVCVNAVNGAGKKQESWVCSDGVLVDKTVPETAEVSSVNPISIMASSACLNDIDRDDVQGSDSEIKIVWEPFYDRESFRLFFLWEVGELDGDEVFMPTLQPLQLIGVTAYDSSFLNSTHQRRPFVEGWGSWADNCTNCKNETWSSLGVLAAHSREFRLRDGAVVFARLWCVNEAGLASSRLTSGIRVDLTGPDGTDAFVFDVVHGRYQDWDHVAKPTQLIAFASGFRDCESVPRLSESPVDCGQGIRSIQYAFGTAPGLDDVVGLSAEQCYDHVPQLSPGQDLPLALEGGQQYYSVVLVCNRAGLCRNFSSDGIIADFSDPAGGAVSDSPSAVESGDMNLLPSSQNSFCASWSNFSDLETGIAGYEVAWGQCRDNVDDMSVQGFVPVGLNLSHCFVEVDLVAGEEICSVVRTTNSAGMQVKQKSNGFLVCGPPTAGIISHGTRFGSGQAQRFQANNRSLAFSWKGFRDDGAPLLRYSITVFASRLTLKAETLVFGPVRTHNLLAWSHNMTLLHGYVYRAEVCGIDVLDQTACANSSGIVIDLTPPRVGVVTSGQIHGKHERFHSDASTIQASWSGFADPESDLIGFEWALGSTRGSTDIQGFQTVGFNTRASSSVQLLHGGKIHVLVKATNGAGLSTVVVSEEVVVVLHSPTIDKFEIRHSGVHVQEGNSVWNSTANLLMWWEIRQDATAASVAFPAPHIWISVGSLVGMDDVKPLFKAPSDAPIPVPDLNRTVTRAFVNIFVEDSFGRIDHRTVPLTIDPTPPSQGDVWISSESGETFLASSKASVNFHWSKFYDGESGIDKYLVGLGRSPDNDDIVAFVDVGGAESYELRGPFPAGEAFFTVVALNPGGLWTSSSVSMVIDATPPVSGAVREVFDDIFEDVDCVEGLQEVRAAWDAFEDAESGIGKYEVAVVCMNASAADTTCGERRFEDAGLALSLRLEVAMSEGGRYQVVVRGWNRAGLYSEAISGGFMAFVASHRFDSISLSWRSDIATDNCTSRLLVAEFSVAYPLSQPMPTVNVALGTCEQCDNIFRFQKIQDGSQAMSNESNWPLNRTCHELHPLLISSKTRLKICSGTGPCQSAHFLVKWSVDSEKLPPCFLVVKASSCSRKIIFGSMPVPVDDATPPQRGTVSLVADPHRRYFSASSTLLANWTNFYDGESGIDKYLVGLGRSPDNDDIVAFVDVGGAESYELRGPFPAGEAFFTVVALNPGGLWTSSSVSMVIDATPPVSGAVREVFDDIFEDVDCVEGLQEVRAAWDAFEDAESGIGKYEVAVVCMNASAADTTCGERRFEDAGLALSLRLEVAMSEGGRYQVVVRGWNRAGLYSEAISDGFRSLVPPNSITLSIDREGLFSSEAGVVAEGVLLVSDIGGILQSVDYGAGTAEKSLVLHSLTPLFSKDGPDAPGVHEFEWRLHLSLDVTYHGHPLFITFRTTTCAGGKVSTSSHFVGKVDFTPPDSTDAEVEVVQTRHLPEYLELAVHWAGFEDPETGIKAFSVGIGFRQGTDEVSPFENVGDSRSTVVRVPENLNKTLLVTVVAWNHAGKSAFHAVSVHPRHSLEVPPSSIPYFVTRAGKQVQAQQVSAMQELRVVWGVFGAVWCPIKGYEVAIVCEDLSSSDPAVFKSVGQGTSVVISHQRVRSNMCTSSFHVLVRGSDQCGLSATAKTRSVEFVQHDPPRIVSIVDGDAVDDDKDVSGNSSGLAATAVVLNCGEFCSMRCALGSLPFSFNIAKLSEEWVVSRTTSSTKGEQQIVLVRCWFPSTSLENGRKYFSGLEVEYGDETLIAESNGVTVDWTRPTKGRMQVRIGDLNFVEGPVYTTSSSVLNVSWSDFRDPESGPLSFRITILATCNVESTEDNSVLGLFEVSPGVKSSLIQMKSNQEMEQGAMPCLCLSAINKAGLETSVCVELSVDKNAPSLGVVLDGPHGFDAVCQLSNTAVSASWKGFASHPSPIVYYEWAVGSCPFCTDIVAHTKVSATASSAQLQLRNRLRFRQVLWTSVRATNSLGLWTEATSNGVQVVCFSEENCTLPEDASCV